MTDTIRQIDQLTTAIEAHGYFVMMEPIAGEESLFVDALRESFAKIEAVLAVNAKRYRMRGLSNRALAALHRDLPNPAWGVEVAK